MDFGGAAPPGRPPCLRLCWCCLVKKKNSKVSKQVAPPWSVGWWKRGGAVPPLCVSPAVQKSVFILRVFVKGCEARRHPRCWRQCVSSIRTGFRSEVGQRRPGGPRPRVFNKLAGLF